MYKKYAMVAQPTRCSTSMQHIVLAHEPISEPVSAAPPTHALEAPRELRRTAAPAVVLFHHLVLNARCLAKRCLIRAQSASQRNPCRHSLTSRFSAPSHGPNRFWRRRHPFKRRQRGRRAAASDCLKLGARAHRHSGEEAASPWRLRLPRAQRARGWRAAPG